MVRKVLILPDVHLKQQGPSFVYRCVKNFLPYFKPHETILLGDFMDCEALSHWNEDKKRLMENKRYKSECDVANNELDYIQRFSKSVTYLQGNHELWVEQYVDRHPEIESLLEIPLMLGLDKRKVRFKAINELYKLGNCYFLHGLYINQYHANKHLTKMGCNICYGHTHNAQTSMMNMRMQEPFMSYGLGCLCSHKPSYMKNKHANWIDQFAVMLYDTKTDYFHLTPINIIEGEFIYNNGKRFRP